MAPTTAAAGNVPCTARPSQITVASAGNPPTVSVGAVPKSVPRSTKVPVPPGSMTAGMISSMTGPPPKAGNGQAVARAATTQSTP